VLRVSTHWYGDGTSVLMRVENMLRNKCFSSFEYNMFLCFMSMCDLFTDSSSYYTEEGCSGSRKLQN
jgi:hypothetical protein